MTTTTTMAEVASLVGAELGSSDWHENTQEHVGLFADATGDHRWIHVVAARGPVRAGARGHRHRDGGQLRARQGPVPRPRTGAPRTG